jgi:signal transduction histidine kinase
LLVSNRKRTALALYVLLLVLPTAVLGGLHWHQLSLDQRSQRAAVPLQVRDAARRLSDGIARRLALLIDSEDRRGFEQYRQRYAPRAPIGADVVFLESSILHDEPPEGILGYFSYELSEGPLAPFEMLPPGMSRPEEWRTHEPVLRDSVARLVEHDWREGFYQRITRVSRMRNEEVPLVFAALNASRERDVQCLLSEGEKLASLQGKQVPLRHGYFHLRFYREPDGTPRVVATRPVRVEGHPALRTMPDCFNDLWAGRTIQQGFFIDPAWLFGEVPIATASRVLEGSLDFVPAGAPPIEGGAGQEVETIRPVEELGLETYSERDLDYGSLQVAVGTRELEARFRSQTRRFLGMAVMLALSLATGLLLLLRSVRRDLEQARRTENFVAAVTHELRTPVSAIRLHGEMLRDGWAVGEERQKQYYERIVSEALRLETMVERVLEKARLDSTAPTPEHADLNIALRPIVESLAQLRGARPGDLALELAPGLPQAVLRAEALSSIVVNLVENARKYAPVRRNGAAGGEPVEPILVRTLLHRGHPALEVLDRGPGIPPEERERIFEAFYRLGTEATRSSRGTGLGLHLVKTQAQALGGTAEVVDRPGGGSIFRVSFQAGGTSA